MRKSPYEGPAVAPFVVNACFGIEIYLKTILEAQGKKHKTHDLSKLHRALDTGTRQTIDLAAADVQPRYTLPTDFTFEGCLSDLSNAFVQWRYLYEQQRLSMELQSIRYILHTLFEATCRVREECA